MEALGAELVGGVWNWNGEPVEVSILIRTEDERVQIGDYVGNQLEDIGFTVIRDYKTAAEASPIWISGDPALGLFHIYTGGWITTAVPRNLAGNFAFFYTDTGLASPLWQAYVNDPEFYDLAQALDNSEFSSAEERLEMMSKAMELALKDSYRVWLLDRASVTPAPRRNLCGRRPVRWHQPAPGSGPDHAYWRGNRWFGHPGYPQHLDQPLEPAGWL
jgi:peptide/nickel transport system substrate-binding protein